MTRTEVIALLNTVMVAPVTSSRRGAPSDGTLSPAKRQEVCRALAIATGCL